MRLLSVFFVTSFFLVTACGQQSGSGDDTGETTGETSVAGADAAGAPAENDFLLDDAMIDVEGTFDMADEAALEKELQPEDEDQAKRRGDTKYSHLTIGVCKVVRSADGKSKRQCYRHKLHLDSCCAHPNRYLTHPRFLKLVNHPKLKIIGMKFQKPCFLGPRPVDPIDPIDPVDPIEFAKETNKIGFITEDGTIAEDARGAVVAILNDRVIAKTELSGSGTISVKGPKGSGVAYYARVGAPYQLTGDTALKARLDGEGERLLFYVAKKDEEPQPVSETVKIQVRVLPAVDVKPLDAKERDATKADAERTTDAADALIFTERDPELDLMLGGVGAKVGDHFFYTRFSAEGTKLGVKAREVTKAEWFAKVRAGYEVVKIDPNVTVVDGEDEAITITIRKKAAVPTLAPAIRPILAQ